MLVAPSALVMTRIGRDRCGPLMTVVVPWTILRISSKPDRAQRRVRRVVTPPVTLPELCAVVDWGGEVDPRVKEESSWMLGLACQPRSPTPREERLWNGRGGPR